MFFLFVEYLRTYGTQGIYKKNVFFVLKKFGQKRICEYKGWFLSRARAKLGKKDFLISTC